MSRNITITLTDMEYKALEVVAYSPTEWVENVTKVRAEKAIKTITDDLIQQKLDAGEPISGTREEIFNSADLQTAQEITDGIDEQS